jgi:diguanylate cyclase (GGDEF)-like protein
MTDEYEALILDLMQKGRTDDLTGLGNRRAFMEYCRHLQGLGITFDVVLLDMTNLKRANEVLGHFGADDLLRSVGHAIRGAWDTVYRHGGDEFAVVLPWCGDGTKVRNRIEQRVGVNVLADGTVVRAIGSVAHISPDADLCGILNQTDKELERRKADWKARP